MVCGLGFDLVLRSCWFLVIVAVVLCFCLWRFGFVFNSGVLTWCLLCGLRVFSVVLWIA